MFLDCSGMRLRDDVSVSPPPPPRRRPLPPPLPSLSFSFLLLLLACEFIHTLQKRWSCLHFSPLWTAGWRCCRGAGSGCSCVYRIWPRRRKVSCERRGGSDGCVEPRNTRYGHRNTRCGHYAPRLQPESIFLPLQDFNFFTTSENTHLNCQNS